VKRCQSWTEVTLVPASLAVNGTGRVVLLTPAGNALALEVGDVVSRTVVASGVEGAASTFPAMSRATV
jgi:hypothetical protein